VPDGRLADVASLDVPPTIREVLGERKFDGTFSRDDVSLLWRVAARTDSRIEPIPCGVCQWHEDRSNAIIEIARAAKHARCANPTGSGQRTA
jgi:hypothetical protein